VPKKQKFLRFFRIFQTLKKKGLRRFLVETKAETAKCCKMMQQKKYSKKMQRAYFLAKSGSFQRRPQFCRFPEK